MAKNHAQRYISLVFTHAGTLDETACYANKLGISVLKVDDLEIANHINQGITIYKNKTQKSRLIFDRVLYEQVDKKEI